MWNHYRCEYIGTHHHDLNSPRDTARGSYVTTFCATTLQTSCRTCSRPVQSVLCIVVCVLCVLCVCVCGLVDMLLCLCVVNL